jgi:putative transposon-encoded protein
VQVATPAVFIAAEILECIGCSTKTAEMPMERKVEEKQEIETINGSSSAPGIIHSKVKFEVFGEEMLEKNVKSSGNSGRVYLPPDWVGHRVKIIRID